MISSTRPHFAWLAIALIFLSINTCKGKDRVVAAKDLPDLNQQIRPFVTTDRTRVRSGPGSNSAASPKSDKMPRSMSSGEMGNGC
jgi:hypothetical protein